MTTDRTKYHITKVDDGWKIKKEGGERASAKTGTKEEAVQEARRIARNVDGPSQVIIHKADGKIQEERTYGNDPYPPKG